jgi:hypothetical protein
MDHEKSNGCTGHHPEPVQLTAYLPGCLVQMVYVLTSGLIADHPVMGFDGLGCPVDNFLNGSLADMYLQDRGAKCLDCFTGIAVNAAKFGNQGGKTGTKTRGIFIRNISFGDFSACCACAPVENEMKSKGPISRGQDV